MLVLRIKELRRAAGFDQIQLGQAVGVSQGTVSDWESERYLPKTRQLPLLAEVLGVRVGELFQQKDTTEEAS